MINNLLCDGEAPKYIFYASDIPQYIYYIFLPSIITTFFLGFFVFLKNRTSSYAKVFFVLTSSMVFWMVSMLGNWAQNDSGLSVMFDELNVLVSIIPIVFVYFILHIFYEEKNTKRIFLRNLLIVSPILPILYFLPSRYNVELIDLGWCETSSGKLYWYLAFILVSYALVIFFLLINRIRKYSDINDKRKVEFILVGFSIWTIISVIMGVLLPLFNYPTSTLWAPISCTLFAFFISLSIVRYGFLNIKVLGAQALVVAMNLIIASEYFFAESDTNKILVGITLILSLGFGYALIKSIKREIERKEELQNMSDKLAMANDQLRKLDNAKTEFISIASHQLRTPLTSVKGFVSLILEGSYGEISKPVKDALEKVYTSSERLIQLVEDLLNVSRIESGRMQFVFEKSKIENILKNLYDNFLLVAKTKSMYLDLKLPEKSLPEINIDSAKIEEVVSNFIDNALKYTEKGGVTIKAMETEIGTIKIIIADTGIGVPKEELPYLFKKFSRGKDISRLNAGGTGLGLYVAKNIVEAHKGKVWIESEGTGKGSRFIIELPIERTGE